MGDTAGGLMLNSELLLLVVVEVLVDEGAPGKAHSDSDLMLEIPFREVRSGVWPEMRVTPPYKLGRLE